MINRIRASIYFKTIFTRFFESRQYILLAALMLASAAIASVSVGISNLSRSSRDLDRKERVLLSKLAARPPELQVRRASLLPGFPDFNTLLTVIMDTQKSFEIAKVSLRDATQTLQQVNTGDDIGMVTITLHAKGEYQATKTAIANVLARHDELALKSLTFAREQSTEGLVQVEAHLVFFYHRQK